MKRKIAIVANSSWNIINFRRKLIKELISHGYDVLAIAPEDAYSQTLRTIQGLRYRVLKQIQPTGRGIWQDMLLLGEFRRIYREEMPELIFHFTIKPNIYGGLAARQLKIPYVSVLTGLGYVFIKGGLLSKIVALLYRLVFGGAKAVVFQNKDDLAFCRAKGLLQSGKGVIIPGSGVDVVFFEKKAIKAVRPFTFIFIGRLLRDKGVMEFLEAAEQLQRKYACHFLVVGEQGADNPAALSKELLAKWKADPNFTFTGQVKDVRPFLEQAQVMVLPSYREGLPKSALEAMAMGRPVITTDVPGCRETVEPGVNGWLVSVRSAKGLAAAMEKAMLLPMEKLSAMGAESRRIVELKFRDELVISAFLSLLDKGAETSKK